MPSEIGNDITSNAEGADDGRQIIEAALAHVESEYDFAPVDSSSLFQGVYYDSQKVGSHIIRVSSKDGEGAVLKIQLRPLPYDEGFIIRSIAAGLRGHGVRPLKILHDRAWSEDLGFGYLLFEDVSHLPDLWKSVPTEAADKELHAKFLRKFGEIVLPVEKPWVPKPTVTWSEKLSEALSKFHGIAQKSAHKHIEEDELAGYIGAYKEVISGLDNEGEIEFTHGHLSGFDVKYDKGAEEFVVMASLYWSWRPKNYAMVFPIWVDLMWIRDKDISFEAFLERVNAWVDLWPDEVTSSKQFWIMLLERAVITVMLDLGASEWKDDEVKEKSVLLERFKDLSRWIIQEKLDQS